MLSFKKGLDLAVRNDLCLSPLFFFQADFLPDPLELCQIVVPNLLQSTLLRGP